MPTRSPVNGPGPVPQTIASTWSNPTPASASAAVRWGVSSSPCARASTVTRAASVTTGSRRTTPAVTAGVAVSMASTITVSTIRALDFTSVSRPTVDGARGGTDAHRRAGRGHRDQYPVAALLRGTGPAAHPAVGQRAPGLRRDGPTPGAGDPWAAVDRLRSRGDPAVRGLPAGRARVRRRVSGVDR